MDGVKTVERYSCPLAPEKRCVVCYAKKQGTSSSAKLLLCGRCHVASYCSREHQTEHFPMHKRQCNAVKHEASEMAAEEAALRQASPGIFEEYAGHFWGLLHTRDYMRARASLTRALEEIPTERAYRTSLAHQMDCLRLCRGDNLALRDRIPTLMLRLGQDQEAYDFIRWWTDVSQQSRYDWGDMSLPYLCHHGLDLLETPTAAGFNVTFSTTLYHMAIAALIKYRLWERLQRVAAMEEGFLLGLHSRLGEKSPIIKLSGMVGPLLLIYEFLLPSSRRGRGQTKEMRTMGKSRLSKQTNEKSTQERERLDIRTNEAEQLEARHLPSGSRIRALGGASRVLEVVWAHLQELLDLAEEINKRVWCAIVNPEPLLRLPDPPYHSQGSRNEAQLLLTLQLEAWQTSWGAVDMLKKRVGEKPNYDVEPDKW